MDEVYKYLDHFALLSWVNYMAHRIDVGKPNTNFDDRPFIQLPSKRRVKITITVEEYKGDDR